jgi:hypothetical protein
MSRRSYKTVNLPREVANWIDLLLQDAAVRRQLGVGSRDEFVRIAVALLGLSLHHASITSPLETFHSMVQALEERSRREAAARAPAVRPVPR